MCRVEKKSLTVVGTPSSVGSGLKLQLVSKWPYLLRHLAGPYRFVLFCFVFNKNVRMDGDEEEEGAKEEEEKFSRMKQAKPMQQATNV